MIRMGVWEGSFGVKSGEGFQLKDEANKRNKKCGCDLDGITSTSSDSSKFHQ